ncbi:amidase signature domain-containing protein [Amylostereum chailletii]|nr:amidase signature domain-containing protein [Amylostereum chailletii]
MSPEKPQWQLAGLAKRDAVNALIPDAWRIPKAKIPDAAQLRDAIAFPRSFLTAREIEITEAADAQALLTKLATGEYTALEVAEAFCHRAAIAHQTVNCLSEIMFSRALERAKELDAYFEAHKKPIGPLHGLPISLKDQFRVRDTHTSVGFVAWLDKLETPESEAYLVKALREAGAVLYVKTNVPTSLMAIETNNNIMGYTWNPRNRLLSSGGSSGGEAALIAMNGSIVGLGTDIGASVRLPAAVCGIYGLRPSHGRLPYLGVRQSMEGQETVSSVIGPMAHALPDLGLMMESLLAMRPWMHDPKVVELPWRPSLFEAAVVQGSENKGGLVFGMLKFDGVVMPHPPVLRAMEEVKEKLKAAGHEVIEWIPPPHSEAFGIIWDVFSADGGADIHATLALASEVPIPQLATVYGVTAGATGMAPFDVERLWALNERKYAYQTAYAAYWNESGSKTKSGRPVDAVLLPAAPTASFRPGEGIYPGYTSVANVLDYTSVVVPVTVVDKTRDLKNDEYKPVSDMDGLIASHYDPDTFDGTPIAVQIMGRRLQEEHVLGVAEVVDKVLRS